MTDYDVPSSAPRKKGLNPRTMTKKQKAIVVGICCLCAFGALIPVLAHVFSSSYAGSYSQSVTNTLAPAPAFAITAVSDSLGGSCTFTANTASCAQASVTVGGTYSIQVQVSNSGSVAGIVSTMASTGSGGITDSILPAANSQNIAPGLSYNFIFTVASNGAGSDTVSVVLAG